MHRGTLFSRSSSLFTDNPAFSVSPVISLVYVVQATVLVNQGWVSCWENWAVVNFVFMLTYWTTRSDFDTLRSPMVVPGAFMQGTWFFVSRVNLYTLPAPD